MTIATGGLGVSAAFEFGFHGALELGGVPEGGEVVGDSTNGIGWSYEVVGWEGWFGMGV